MGAGLLASACLTSPAGATPRARGGAFDELTDAWRELHGALRAGELTPDEAVFHLEAELARLDPGDVPARRAEAYRGDGLVTGPAWAGAGLFLVVLELAPGARIRAHDHPAHTVVTVLRSGLCRARHFDVLRADGDGTRLLRCTRDVVLDVWHATEVTPGRDNVHEFAAGPEGAVLLDFTMETGTGRFVRMDVEAEPLDAFERTHRARVAEETR